MALNWFSTVYFNPQNGLLPELIQQDGSRTPVSKIGKISALREVLRQSFLKDEKRPFIIYNGTHFIDNLEKLFVTTEHKKILQEQEIAFYFFEPLTHYTFPIALSPTPSHILKINNSRDEINRIRSFELDSITRWADTYNIKKLKVYCTDYKCHEHYQKVYPTITLMNLDLYVSWFSSNHRIFQIKRVPVATNIKKKFWSGAWRYDPSRHFITAYLANQDLTLTNNVSFFFKISNAEFKRRMWFSWREFQARHTELACKLIDGNTKLQKQVPLSIEIDETVALSEYAMDPQYDGAGKNIRASQNPVNSYRESFCAIVLESRVTQPWPNISEKTLNAIKNNRPFVIVGAPGTLSMLKEMGFISFDKWWDESYDDIENNTDRLVKICEIIAYINSFTIEELRSMHTDMSQVLMHNEENIKKISKFYNKVNKRLNKKLSK